MHDVTATPQSTVKPSRSLGSGSFLSFFPSFPPSPLHKPPRWAEEGKRRLNNGREDALFVSLLGVFEGSNVQTPYTTKKRKRRKGEGGGGKKKGTTAVCCGWEGPQATLLQKEILLFFFVLNKRLPSLETEEGQFPLFSFLGRWFGCVRLDESRFGQNRQHPSSPLQAASSRRKSVKTNQRRRNLGRYRSAFHTLTCRVVSLFALKRQYRTSSIHGEGTRCV